MKQDFQTSTDGSSSATSMDNQERLQPEPYCAVTWNAVYVPCLLLSGMLSAIASICIPNSATHAHNVDASPGYIMPPNYGRLWRYASFLALLVFGITILIGYISFLYDYLISIERDISSSTRQYRRKVWGLRIMSFIGALAFVIADAIEPRHASQAGGDAVIASWVFYSGVIQWSIILAMGAGVVLFGGDSALRQEYRALVSYLG